MKKYKGSVRNCDTGLYTHLTNADSFGGSKATILTSWRDNNFTQPLKFFSSVNKIPYNGIHLVISTKNQPPFVIERYGILLTF